MQVLNELEPSVERITEFFGGPGGEPFVMVNLLRFRDKAAYPDGSDADLPGIDAYTRYGIAVVGMIERLGGRLLYAGAVTGLLLGQVEDLWDQVVLVEYPSLAAFQSMVMSPEYQAISRHRDAGLEGQLNIRTKGMF